MAKIKLGVFFGGRSGEHEVSLSSAVNVINAARSEKYEILPIGITRDGAWRLYRGDISAIQSGDWESDAKNLTDDFPVFGGEFGEVDVFFPVLHGTYGEDGTLQGFLEMLGKPYVGCGVLASALCMDKALAKGVFAAAGIPVAKGVTVSGEEVAANAPALADRLIAELSLPIFVKPSNLGSSVGISKAHDRAELIEALAHAAIFDSKILAEEFVKGMELEVAVLGNQTPQATSPGQIIPCREFYDYEAKYLTGFESEVVIPAPIPDDVASLLSETAIKAFLSAGCSGLARVDFFYSEERGICLNEINTLPGFTNISMYPKLWEHAGLSQPDLVDRLVDLAIERHAQRNSLKYKRDF